MSGSLRIINDQQMRLTGYPVDARGAVIPSTPVDLQISASQIPPRATSDVLSGDLEAVLNLDSRDANPAVAPFDFANPSTYNFSTGLTVYDTLGVSHTLTTYYVRTAPGAWSTPSPPSCSGPCWPPACWAWRARPRSSGCSAPAGAPPAKRSTCF